LCAVTLALSVAGLALPAQGQQSRQAQPERQDAARRDQDAATRRQTQQTDKANQDASVHDETSSAGEGARPARNTSPNTSANAGSGNGKPPPLSYGPVLNPRQPQAADPARKDPAEVRDETDSLAREAPPPSQQSQQQKQPKQVQHRRQAWQPEGPLAPRPLRSSDARATGVVPVPAPAAAPQPVVPSSRALNSCVGGACTDAAGGTYNLGPTGTGVSSSGRLCSRSGSTVQCF
jgi:hypothetical protein